MQILLLKNVCIVVTFTEQETGSHLEDMSSLSSKRSYELCGLINKHFCAADLAYQIQGK